MASFTLSRQLLRLFLSIFTLLITHSNALASTDTITWGGDNSRTGYESTHNMDPAVVGSSQFGQLWKTQLPGTWGPSKAPESIYASPLVYTDTDNVQYVFVATQQNNVYKLNAKTGAIVASRNLGRPFLVTDLDACNDIQPVIGITATGVIDATTGVWYLTSKTYADPSANGATGRPNARYFIHALSVADLTEMPNYPVNLEYTVARNNPNRWFTGGIHHQRPALLMQGNYIYAGFASHCILYNYTGWIIGWDKGSGRLAEQFATEGLGVGPSTSGAGVWMSGGGLSADDKGSIYFSTGNGNAYQLSNSPVNGRHPPTSLEEAVVHATINTDGTINLSDMFMPWEKVQLDTGDKDLGTTPFQLLPSQFSCGNVQRIGMVTGKSGKTYWLNVDDLGGYRNGPNLLDNIIQSYQHENIVYSGAGVYPLEGGYVYINIVGYPTRVFQFSCNNAVPYFNPVALSPDTNSPVLGAGHGVTTSLNGQAGTGLFWISDIQGSNLRVYQAVPQNGTLVPVANFNSPGTTKFTKLSFGDGVVFQGSYGGILYAYGSPVNVPLSCTPIQFGSINTGAASSAQTVQCQAKTDVTVTAASLTDSTNFNQQGMAQSKLPIFVPQGQNFSFQVVFNPVTVGSLSSSVLLNTTQAATGYTSSSTVMLRGYGQSQAPLLRVSPPVTSWTGFITGSTPGGVNQSVIFSNLGNTALTISAIQFSLVGEMGPWVTPNGTQTATQASAFTFYGLPSSIPPTTDITVPINFNPPVSGAYAAYMKVTSNGGSSIFDTIATGSDNPAVLIEFENPNGTWTPYSNTTTTFSFGNVAMGTTRSLRMRLTNVGGPNAAAIAMTVSKPPVALPGQMIGTNNQIDLAEGTSIAAGQNKTATLYCSPPAAQINTPTYNQTTGWTMNLNVPGFGHNVIPFFCNAVSAQYGPKAADGSVLYQYAGCYQEYNPGRQLSTMILSSDTMTNELCISQCASAGYIFAGTEWQRECWCGMTRPLLVGPDMNCNYACTGNTTEVCGGAMPSGSYISLFGDRSRWDGNTTNNPGPFVNPGTRGFSSIGCWTDNGVNRTLSVQVNANNTVNSCLQACQGYKYSGVEYGGECYCDNVMGPAGTRTALSDCSMPCRNNYTEYCGAGNRLNVYALAAAVASTSTTTSSTLSSSSWSPSSTSASTVTQSSQSVSTATSIISTSTSTSFISTSPQSTASSSLMSTSAVKSSWVYVGCFTDVMNNRTIIGDYLSNGSVAVTSCMAYCSTKSWPYMGVEYGAECFCGNSIGGVGVLQPDSDCTFQCAGNSSQICGGSNRINVYKYTTVSAAGASTSASSLTSSSTIQSSSTSTATSTSSPSTMATATSTSTTTASSSSSSVLTVTSTSGAISSVTTSSSTSSTSAVTSIASTSPSTSTVSTSTSQSTSPSSTSTSTTSSSSTKTTSAAKSTSTTQPIQYLGCAIDNAGSRTLSDAGTTSNKMDIPTCQAFCASQNMPLSGLEYSTECYCGYTLKTTSALTQTGCTMTCGGNSSQICGGGSRLSVYNNTAWIPTSNKPTVLFNNRGFAYQGCYTDATNARALAAYSFTNSTGMTVEMCVGACQSRAYSFAGVEYAQECYCANALTAAAVKKADTDCNMPCKGDVTEWCGAGGRINIWQATN